MADPATYRPAPGTIPTSPGVYRFRDAKGEFMEKALIEPDLRVANDPALLKAGRDQQLEAAVQELLKR